MEDIETIIITVKGDKEDIRRLRAVIKYIMRRLDLIEIHDS